MAEPQEPTVSPTSDGLGAATIRDLAHERGLDLSDEQVEKVLAFRQAMRADIDRLRSVPLAYVGAVPLPGDALAWIENGGRTLPNDHDENGASR